MSKLTRREYRNTAKRPGTKGPGRSTLRPRTDKYLKQQLEAQIAEDSAEAVRPEAEDEAVKPVKAKATKPSKKKARKKAGAINKEVSPAGYGSID